MNTTTRDPARRRAVHRGRGLLQEGQGNPAGRHRPGTDRAGHRSPDHRRAPTARNDLDTDACLRQRVVYFDFDQDALRPEFQAIVGLPRQVPA